MSPINRVPAEDLQHVFEHTEGLWEELRNGHVFISGGTGFFGLWLLETLLYADQILGLRVKITVLTRNPAAFAAKAPQLAMAGSVVLHRGDVRSFPFIDREFSHVIHAATDASAELNENRPFEMFTIIVDGTRRMLDFAKACRARKFLFTSSGGVYGKQPAEMTHVPEDYRGAPDPFARDASYGEGKRAAELLCAIEHRSSGMEIKIARCFALIGPHLPLDIHFAMGNFLADAIRRAPIHLTGDGTPFRSYLYAADLMIWLWTILFRAPAARPYNVGSEDGRPLWDMAHEVAACCEPRLAVTRGREPIADVPPGRYVPCTSRAREELGLRELIDLRTAILKTYRSLQTPPYGITGEP